LYFGIKHRVPLKGLARLLQAGARVTPEVIIFAREKSRKQVGMLLDMVRTMTIILSARERFRRSRAGRRQQAETRTKKRQCTYNNEGFDGSSASGNEESSSLTSSLVWVADGFPMELLRELRVFLSH